MSVIGAISAIGKSPYNTYNTYRTYKKTTPPRGSFINLIILSKSIIQIGIQNNIKY